jgi:hypothetical protein
VAINWGEITKAIFFFSDYSMSLCLQRKGCSFSLDMKWVGFIRLSYSLIQGRVRKSFPNFVTCFRGKGQKK